MEPFESSFILNDSTSMLRYNLIAPESSVPSRPESGVDECRCTDITHTAHLTRLQHVQVTCRIVNSEGLMLLLCGGLSIPNCHRSGARIPASRRRSLQSFMSAEMFPKAHRDCSLTASSLLLATRPIRRGKAPDSVLIKILIDILLILS